jgi:Flp pilus assembly protein TadD
MSKLTRLSQCSGLTLGLAMFAAPAHAQYEPVPTETVDQMQPESNNPADLLAANLVTLSRNPRDVNALLGAGQSAVAVGDGEAALSFLGRAEVLAPYNGGVKAALGSAYILVERPNDGLRYFGEASSLGVPDQLLARDRGLAYDLRGDSIRAQKDYALALRAGPDDEVSRRFALSLAITGQRDRALNMLDPLLRKRDPAAWRARAFVLALSGDVRGAESIAQQIMAGNSGETLAPFLRRLPKLNPAERAHAVNFGTMPSDGQQLARVEVGDPYRTALPSAPTASRPVTVASVEPRRIPGRAPVETPGPAVPSWSSKPVSNPIVPVVVAAVTAQPAAPQSTPSQSMTARLGQRIETRIGPVDRTKYPSEVQNILGGNAPKPTAALPVGTALPAPVPLATPAAPAVVRPPEPRVVPVSETPAPIFEVPSYIPAAQTPPAQSLPVPVSVTAPVTAPATAPAAAPLSVPVITAVVPKPIPPVALPSPVTVVTAPAAAPATPITPPVQIALATPSAAAPATPPTLLPSAPMPPIAAVIPTTTPTPIAARQIQTVVQPAPTVVPPPEPGFSSVSTPTSVPITPPVPTAAPVVPAAIGLASVMADITPEAESVAAPLPSAAQLRAARLAAQRKAEAAALAEEQAKADALAQKEAKAAAALKEAERLTSKKHPARIWVQVATGANESGLPITWKHLREKSPDVFKGLSASTVPFKSTNRLLVGPFKSASDARALVNAMSKAGLFGSTFSSDAGQEIGKVASR